jgi:hypothetical protein
MSRLRSVHQLTPQEAELQSAVLKPGDTSDHCDSDGAKRLAQRIEQYWRERGYAVDMKLIEGAFIAAMRSTRVDIRSDMVNGMPRRGVAE